jgi:hypothetical protein
VQEVVAGQPRVLLLGHAVLAAQIAAVGYRTQAAGDRPSVSTSAILVLCRGSRTCGGYRSLRREGGERRGHQPRSRHRPNLVPARGAAAVGVRHAPIRYARPPPASPQPGQGVFELRRGRGLPIDGRARALPDPAAWISMSAVVPGGRSSDSRDGTP